MTEKEINLLLEKFNVITERHFISELCKELAEKFKKQEIEVVVSPAIGGVILCQWVAYFLSQIKKERGISRLC